QIRELNPAGGFGEIEFGRGGEPAQFGLGEIQSGVSEDQRRKVIGVVSGAVELNNALQQRDAEIEVGVLELDKVRSQIAGFMAVREIVGANEVAPAPDLDALQAAIQPGWERGTMIIEDIRARFVLEQYLLK